MQPYLFPYLGYYQLVHAVDHFVFYDDVTFIKKGYINRNSILSQGHPMRFTLPVGDASQNRLISEHFAVERIEPLLRTFRQSYSKALFFSSVMPLVERVITAPDRNMARIAASSITCVLDYLGIAKSRSFSSGIAYNRSTKAADRVLAICQAMHATRYINSAGGMELYNEEHFTTRGIELRFLKSKLVPYPQFGAEFVPNLSIIDVLMFNDKNAVTALLEKYELIRGAPAE